MDRTPSDVVIDFFASREAINAFGESSAKALVSGFYVGIALSQLAPDRARQLYDDFASIPPGHAESAVAMYLIAELEAMK